jgi:hypothetical protein
MRTLILLFILTFTSCKSIGYFPLDSEPAQYEDLMNHGIHCPCKDYEFSSFTFRVDSFEWFSVEGNNIPVFYRKFIDSMALCPEGCSIYFKDVYYKTPEGEIIKSKRKLYLDVVTNDLN